MDAWCFWILKLYGTNQRSNTEYIANQPVVFPLQMEGSGNFDPAISYIFGVCCVMLARRPNRISKMIVSNTMVRVYKNTSRPKQAFGHVSMVPG